MTSKKKNTSKCSRETLHASQNVANHFKSRLHKQENLEKRILQRQLHLLKHNEKNMKKNEKYEK